MTLDDLLADLGTASPVFVPTGSFPAALVREAIASGLVSEWEDSPVGRADAGRERGGERSVG